MALIKRSSVYLIAALLSLACAVYLDPEENFTLEWTVNDSTNATNPTILFQAFVRTRGATWDNKLTEWRNVNWSLQDGFHSAGPMVPRPISLRAPTVIRWTKTVLTLLRMFFWTISIALWPVWRPSINALMEHSPLTMKSTTTNTFSSLLTHLLTWVNPIYINWFWFLIVIAFSFLFTARIAFRRLQDTGDDAQDVPIPVRIDCQLHSSGYWIFYFYLYSDWTFWNVLGLLIWNVHWPIHRDQCERSDDHHRRWGKLMINMHFNCLMRLVNSKMLNVGGQCLHFLHFYVFQNINKMF